MADLVLSGFPDSLVARVDRYIRLLEELNPGYRWSRTSCIATLVVRALAEIEGAEIRACRSRRKGEDRRTAEREGSERRRGPDERRSGLDRRQLAYPEMVDLVIEQLLREKHGLEDDATWRDRHEG